MTNRNYKDYYYKYKALKYYLKNNSIEIQKQIKGGSLTEEKIDEKIAESLMILFIKRLSKLLTLGLDIENYNLGYRSQNFSFPINQDTNNNSVINFLSFFDIPLTKKIKLYFNNNFDDNAKENLIRDFVLSKIHFTSPILLYFDKNGTENFYIMAHSRNDSYVIENIEEQKKIFNTFNMDKEYNFEISVDAENLCIEYVDT